MPENEYQRLSKELSRSAFAKRYPHPFVVFGDLEDDWPFEFKTRSVGPVGWTGFLASDDKLKRTTLTELPADDDPSEEPLGGIEPVTKSSRNPYSDRISIGRSKTNDVILPSPHVSKLHAHFLTAPDGSLELRDAGSANGTFKNGTRLRPDERVPLRSGDKLRFGWMETQFLDAAGLYDWLRKKRNTSDFR